MSSPSSSFLPSCNSSHPWRPLGKLLDLYVLPAVCLSGLFLNIACIVVFAQRKTIVLYYSANAAPTGAMATTTTNSFSAANGRKASGGGNLATVASRPSNGHHRHRDQRLANGSSLLSREMAQDQEQYISVRTRQATRRSHPLVPVLIVLCLCDSLQLLFSLLVLYLPALHDHLEMDPLGWIAQLAYLATGGLAGGLLAANCASIWTMCFISVQRHRAIVRPLSTMAISSARSKLSLALIGLAALLFNLPVWFEFKWAAERVTAEDGTERRMVYHSRSRLAQNDTYLFLMHKILYPLCVYLIPLVLISVLNIRILAFIHSSSRLQSVGHRRRMAKERRSVWLLISIVLLFFLCHTGGLVIRLADLRRYYNEACFVFAKDLVNFLFNINSFANPMLYFFFTKQFRDLRTTWAQSCAVRASANLANNNAKRTTQKQRQQRQQRPLLGANGGRDRSEQMDQQPLVRT